MKQRIAKLGNKTKMIAGGIFLAVLMAVNLQVGMNDGSTTDISLLGLEASVFASAAVATVSGSWGYVCCGASCEFDHCLGDGNYTCCKKKKTN